METVAIGADLREKLRVNGFVVVKHAVDVSLLDAARDKVWATLKDYGGELVQPEGELPYCLPLPLKQHYPMIDHAEALMQSIGADPYNLQNLMLIMKRPHEGRRYWHTDMPPIFEPSAEDPPEVFILYFLQPTSVALANGCLLVVPGYADGPQHSERVTTPFPGEYPIEIDMGDVIMLDPRLLHGSLPNESDDYRFNVRLWIQTRWKEK